MRNIENEAINWKTRLEGPEGIWDETFLTKAQAGDSNAIEKLLHRYQRRIARIVDSRLRGVEVDDKEDLFQEALVSVFEGIHEHIQEVDSEHAFLQWLVMEVTQVLADWLENKARQGRALQWSDNVDLRSLFVEVSNRFEASDHTEMIEMLLNAAGQRSQVYRLILQNELDGGASRDLAITLGMDENVLRHKRRRLFEWLRSEFGHGFRD